MTTALREAIVREAESWMGTPYHHQGDVKGAGVDCVMILVRIYQSFCLVPGDFDPRPYVPDWHMHRGEERYLEGLLRFGVQVEQPKPGDVAVYRYGRTYSHGGIIVDWPTIIHAHRVDGKVVKGNGNAGDLAGRRVAFFSIIKD